MHNRLRRDSLILLGKYPGIAYGTKSGAVTLIKKIKN